MSVNSERTECFVDSVSTFTSTDISEEVNTIADDECDVVLNDKASMEKPFHKCNGYCRVLLAI